MVILEYAYRVFQNRDSYLLGQLTGQSETFSDVLNKLCHDSSGTEKQINDLSILDSRASFEEWNGRLIDFSLLFVYACVRVSPVSPRNVW